MSNEMLDSKTSSAMRLILIVDDSVEVIREITAILHGKANIIFATDGETGIRLAVERSPDIILLDFNMPGMNGFSTCRKLKNREETKHAVVIIITANIAPDTEKLAIEAGAAGVISKPLIPALVSARIQAQITRLDVRSAIHQ